MLEQGAVFMSREGMKKMAKDKRLTDDPHALLIYLVTNLEHLNWFSPDFTVLAKQLKITPLEVARHLKLLGELGYISKKGEYDKVNLYRMSPEIAWLGTMEELEEEFS